MPERPDFLVDRVVAPAPNDCGVLAMSTPVVAFGNARVARVATLGLNPSCIEFLNRAGQELVEIGSTVDHPEVTRAAVR